MPKRLDLVGQRFGRWIVIAFAEVKSGNTCWLCECVCGNRKVVSGNILKRRKSKSCGCWDMEVRRRPKNRPRFSTRSEARSQGHVRYIGKICDKHPELHGERYVCSAKCVRCGNERGLAHAKKPETRKKRNFNRRRRLKTDAQYRLSQVLRSRLHHALARRAKKSAPTEVLIGCTVAFVVKHLESQFMAGMSWANHGSEWEVDHKKPVASFDLTRDEEQKACFHYSNLQPLWKHANRRKRAKPDYQLSAIDLERQFVLN